MTVISYSEWMAELERLKSEVPETRGLTMQELVQQYGHSKEWISLRVLRPLRDKGKLQTFKRKTRDLMGRTCWVTEYAIRSVPHEKIG